MTASTQNRLTECVMVGGSACLIVGAVAAMDGTVRGQLTGAIRGEGMPLVASAGIQAQRAWKTAIDTVGYHGTEDTTLVVFAVAAVVLFVLMFKV